MDTSALAKRMKKYEAVPKNTLMRRTPVIIRVDGRAFHTFTKGFQKPFDDVLVRVMQDTMMSITMRCVKEQCLMPESSIFQKKKLRTIFIGDSLTQVETQFRCSDRQILATESY